jgi:hypothetical protein
MDYLRTENDRVGSILEATQEFMEYRDWHPYRACTLYEGPF